MKTNKKLFTEMYLGFIATFILSWRGITFISLFLIEKIINFSEWILNKFDKNENKKRNT